MTDLSLALSFRQELRNCTRCPLSQQTTPVPWYGNLRPKYALMGEAPGAEEEKLSQPFVGKSGSYLRYWLKEVGIDPMKVTYLNSVMCRPTGNRTPKDDELKACSPWVNGSLEFIRPEILITVGVVAFNQIRRVARPKLAVLHGKPMYHPRYRFTCFSTYHPAAALRGSKKYERIIKEDLAAIANWNGTHLDDCYICGKEVYRFDEWGIALCRLHAQNQGMLFPEDLSVG